MEVFVGQCRGGRLIARLSEIGIGEMTQPDEYPPRRRPYILDNAAFKAWKAGRPLDEEAFRVALDACRVDPPVFVVVPDKVAAGIESLSYSMSWVEECRERSGAPCYLVVQDGMQVGDVEYALDNFDGLFVGGTISWKIRTGEKWARLAHDHGKPCHIGRVGTPRRVRWAQRIGADSIDSSLPLWSEEKLRQFLRALAPSAQLELRRTA